MMHSKSVERKCNRAGLTIIESGSIELVRLHTSSVNLTLHMMSPPPFFTFSVHIASEFKIFAYEILEVSQKKYCESYIFQLLFQIELLSFDKCWKCWNQCEIIFYFLPRADHHLNKKYCRFFVYQIVKLWSVCIYVCVCERERERCLRVTCWSVWEYVQRPHNGTSVIISCDNCQHIYEVFISDSHHHHQHHTVTEYRLLHPCR